MKTDKMLTAKEFEESGLLDDFNDDILEDDIEVYEKPKFSLIKFMWHHKILTLFIMFLLSPIVFRIFVSFYGIDNTINLMRKTFHFIMDNKITSAIIAVATFIFAFGIMSSHAGGATDANVKREKELNILLDDLKKHW